MAGRKKVSKRDSETIVSAILLVALMTVGYFQSNPIVTSLSCSGVSALALIGGLWFRQRRAIRNVNRVAGRQMYLDYTPRQFEQAVAELFRAQGYKAKLTPGSGDGGLDILLSK